MLFFFTKEFRANKSPWKQYVVELILAFVISLIVLNAGYAFEGTFASLSDYGWKSEFFNAIKSSFAGGIPLPLPHLYLSAIDEQFFNRNVFVYYLNGNLSKSGWASYYWFALLLKTPIPLLAASAAALVLAFRRKAGFIERILWASPAVFMFVFTLYVRIDMGIRYLYPMMPFLFVLGGVAIAKLSEKGRAGTVVATVICVWYCLSIATTFGNGLAYFNEFAGGPAGGHRYLVESNLDWGQNLVRLKKYVDENKPEPLLVYNYGLVPPAAYGIEKAGWVPCRPTSAVIAISVNYLKGVDPFQHRGKECFSWLAERKPVATLGNGLWVFDTRNDKNIKVR